MPGHDANVIDLADYRERKVRHAAAPAQRYAFSQSTPFIMAPVPMFVFWVPVWLGYCGAQAAVR